jgi:UDP-N-acetylmuramate dehydrogenase
MNSSANLQVLRTIFSDRLHTDVSLKRFSVARIGGKADYLISANSAVELEELCRNLWEMEFPFYVLGSASNVLVSDAGVRQVIVLNRAKKIRFITKTDQPSVWVESGANLGALARRAASQGFSGLEWAAGIPGTVGGAVYGNAGAHAADMAGCLLVAKILHRIPSNGYHKQEVMQEEWLADHFEYAYRSSVLKRQPGLGVVLSAELKLDRSTPELVTRSMGEYAASRRNSQPSGASLGSIFKNPPADYAGRLIEAAGLKGTRIGKVEISEKHANFFISREGASAQDYASLIKLAQKKVFDEFGVQLELEIELLGDWSG